MGLPVRLFPSSQGVTSEPAMNWLTYHGVRCELDSLTRCHSITSEWHSAIRIVKTRLECAAKTFDKPTFQYKPAPRRIS